MVVCVCVFPWFMMIFYIFVNVDDNDDDDDDDDDDGFTATGILSPDGVAVAAVSRVIIPRRTR